MYTLFSKLCYESQPFIHPFFIIKQIDHFTESSAIRSTTAVVDIQTTHNFRNKFIVGNEIQLMIALISMK